MHLETATPSSTSPPPQLTPGKIIGPLTHGLWAGFSSSPWTVFGGIVFLVLLGFAAVQSLRFPKSRRDKFRRFSRQEKAEILRRAGNRCEHHSFGIRCESTERLEADHIVPWSRSGQTIISNGQALCRRHNRLKNAHIPMGFELRRLARRRAAYFPPDAPTEVVWRRR